jgi:hypothetical protein
MEASCFNQFVEVFYDAYSISKAYNCAADPFDVFYSLDEDDA